MECLISESMMSFRFATDCSELISILDNSSEWPTLAVEFQLFKLLKLSFPSFSIRFIPRCNNICADCLAKKGKSTRFFILSCKHIGFGLVLSGGKSLSDYLIKWRLAKRKIYRGMGKKLKEENSTK
ncbi:unnamed protein product [Arabidopsis halleri]